MAEWDADIELDQRPCERTAGIVVEIAQPEDELQMSESVPEARRLLANVAALWTPPAVVAEVLEAYWLALPAFARPDFLRAYGRPVHEDQLLRARVWAFYVGAILLAYALDVGDDELAREALGSLERTAS